jgi:hypothetical protein
MHLERSTRDLYSIGGKEQSVVRGGQQDIRPVTITADKLGPSIVRAQFVTGVQYFGSTRDPLKAQVLAKRTEA